MLKTPLKNTNTSLPILYFDGGSRGNPGQAAGAAVIVMPEGEKFAVSQYLEFATNNEAEYTGLIIGLQKAKEMGINALVVQGDSQLVINQINGQWQVKSPNLQELYQQAKSLMKGFKNIKINWVRRHENHLADAEANKCMDKRKQNQEKVTKKNYIADKNKSSEPTVLPNSKNCYYSKGDVILISNPLEATVNHEALVMEKPELTKDRKWRITLEIS
jgi:ribonuclease HI